MRWKKESYGKWLERMEEWNTWFAWYPTRIGEEIVWLESVERRIGIITTWGIIWYYRKLK